MAKSLQEAALDAVESLDAIMDCPACYSVAKAAHKRLEDALSQSPSVSAVGVEEYREALQMLLDSLRTGKAAELRKPAVAKARALLASMKVQS